MSLLGMVGNVFGSKHGNAIITESLEPISFNGKDAISLDITGEGLLFLDPSKNKVAKTIALTGIEIDCRGPLLGPSKYKVTGHDAMIDSDSWVHQSTCTLHGTIDAEFPIGYQGPLFAQVTGPGHASSKVQVGFLVQKPDYGVPIIKECLEGIPFNGKDAIRLEISGDYLIFADPNMKDGFGHAQSTAHTISVTGSEGSGVWKYANTGYGSCGGSCTLSGTVDPESHEGYEGPLFAQVTGPGPTSSKVQVGILMTEKDYNTYVAKRDREQLIKELTDQFAQLDPNKDGFLTRAGIEGLMGGAETFEEVLAMYDDMKKKYEAGDPHVTLQGGPAGLKFMDAVLHLKGDDRASLADLLLVCELA